MIEPRHLKTLRALADHGTVNAAAGALHLTPSAVSQQLTALSKATGCTLLERRGRRVALTEPALVLLDHADAILERYELVEADLRAYQDSGIRRLRVSAVPTAIAGFLATAVARLTAEHPGWHIEVEDAESEDSLVRLLDQGTDAAVVMVAPNRPLLSDRRIALEPLVTDPYYAVLPAGHRLAGRARIDLADLAGDPWIRSCRRTSCHEVVEAACAAAGFQPGGSHFASDFLAAMALVSCGLGVTLTPRLGLPPVLPPTVRVLPLGRGAAARRISLATRRGDSRPELLRTLREEARTAVAAALPVGPLPCAQHPHQLAEA